MSQKERDTVDAEEKETRGIEIHEYGHSKSLFFNKTNVNVILTLFHSF